MILMHACGQCSKAPSGRTALHRFALLAVPLFLVTFAMMGGTAHAAVKSAAVKAQARKLAAQVGALDGRIDVTVAAYARATDALATLRAEADDNRRQLGLTQYNIDLARQALAARAVASYKQQTVSVLDVLFSSATFTDMLGGFDMMQRMSAQDANVVGRLESLKVEVTARRARLAADEKTAQQLVTTLGASVSRIRGELAARQKLLASARAEVARLAALAVKAKAKIVVVSTGGLAAQRGSGQWWPLIRSAAAANGIDATGMYRLMMIESGGSPSASNSGQFLGLYQYAPSTWRASWNPWHAASIFDGAAQIKATALALHLGHGPAWWPNSYPWAFAGT